MDLAKKKFSSTYFDWKYGMFTGDSSFSADTIQNIYDCGKNMESIVMAMLYDKGLFQYKDLVS